MAVSTTSSGNTQEETLCRVFVLVCMNPKVRFMCPKSLCLVLPGFGTPEILTHSEGARMLVGPIAKLAQTPPKLELYLEELRTLKAEGKLVTFLTTNYRFSLEGRADSPRNIGKKHPDLGQLMTFFHYYNRIKETRNEKHACDYAQVPIHTKRSRKLQKQCFFTQLYFLFESVFAM